MRRQTFTWPALALLLVSLGLASIAEARAGSRGGVGSRGSRSFSAPRAPQSPLAPGPSTPRPETPAPAPGTVPPARGPFGAAGGLGGMLGGLLLGGVLGSLLFGGLGHAGGGIGLLEIALVGGLAYFLLSRFRRREPVPATASAHGGTGWPAAPPAAAGGRLATVPVDDDLDRGVAAIRVMETGFDPAAVAETAAKLFRRVQEAWTRSDLGPVRTDLTDDVADALEADLAGLRALHRVNRVERVTVHAAEVTEAWQEYGRDFVTVRLRASAVDTTVDEATGRVLEGDPVTPAPIEEYWTLTRAVGPGAWRLTAIQPPAA